MSKTHNKSFQHYKQLTRFFLEREIADLYMFLQNLDDNLEGMRTEVSKKIENFDNEMTTLQDSEYREELINLKVEAEQFKGFSNLLRQSFLTSLYSFMELWLLRDCHTDSNRRDNGQSYQHTKGKGIEKAKRYYVNVKGSHYSFGESLDWLWIKNFQLLRDCIIHRQGSLTGFSNFEVDARLVKFVNNEAGLSLFGVNNQQIFIEFEFCMKALQTVHRFMIELLALKMKDIYVGNK